MICLKGSQPAGGWSVVNGGFRYFDEYSTGLITATNICRRDSRLLFPSQASGLLATLLTPWCLLFTFESRFVYVVLIYTGSRYVKFGDKRISQITSPHFNWGIVFVPYTCGIETPSCISGNPINLAQTARTISRCPRLLVGQVQDALKRVCRHLCLIVCLRSIRTSFVYTRGW